MRKTLLIITLLFSSIATWAQNYNFNGTMSKETLELYLSRAITMAGLAGQWHSDAVAYQANRDMLVNTQARFIGRSAGMWGNENQISFGYFNDVGTMVTEVTSDYINAGMEKPIFQAGIFEIVTPQVNGITMSQEVADAYNGGVVKKFNIDEMMYPSTEPDKVRYWWNDATQSWGPDIKPDITKIETRMWFYYLATQYIDQGIEAIHMGNVNDMDKLDPNYESYWELMTRIRNYASTRNRNLVLLDGHSLDKKYIDPNTSQEFLPFDFGAMPCRPQGTGQNWGTNNGGPAILKTYYPVQYDIPYGRAPKGLTPLGWYTSGQPYLVELDNYGGVLANVNNNTTGWNVWGWDEITWFSIQSQQYRDDWLAYAHYKVKCLDENAFFQMPGMRPIVFFDANGNKVYTSYRAANTPANPGSTTYYNNENTIRDVWNGNFTGDNAWIHHNFTDEDVLNPPATPHVENSLIKVGSDKLFYISDDGRIHGYVKDNGLPGVWSTVSPSWVANNAHGQNINNQVQAASDLVASPDGSTLLYIGVDGFIHGYNIIDPWDYTYFDFMVPSMVQQFITAKSDLVYASNDQIYYIAEEALSSGAARVHGFIKTGGSWSTVSPAHASQVSVGMMTEPSRGLEYHNNRLYYIGVDDFLYYYDINTYWSYTYQPGPNGLLTSQGLKIASTNLAINGDKIYYIGEEILNGNVLRIHALIDNAGTWSTVSPSHSASMYNGQPIANQYQAKPKDIAVSPNGKYISYIGVDNKVYYYEDISGGWNFSYNKTWGSGFGLGVLNSIAASNSLQYTDDDNLFYISTGAAGDKKVHYYQHQESFCQNSFIDVIEPTFKQTYYRPGRSSGDAITSDGVYSFDDGADNNSNADKGIILSQAGGEVSVYPNPATNTLNIKGVTGNAVVQVINSVGQVVYKGSINSTHEQIDMSHLQPGVYILRINGDNALTISRKITKK